MNKPEFETHRLFEWGDIVALRDYVVSTPLEYVAIDTETDNVIERKANLYGIGLCFDASQTFYIPIRQKDGTSWWSSDQEAKIQSLIGFICSRKVLAHNGIYDILVLLYNWGLNITDSLYSDTILQKHILDEERPFGLKEVAVKYLGPWADKAQEALYINIEANGGSTTKDNMQMFKADTEVLADYCMYDVLLTRLLFDIFEERIHKEELADLFYKDEIMPLYREVTIPMKIRGFPIDVPYFEQLLKDVILDIKKLEASIQTQLSSFVSNFCEDLLNKDYPISKKGSFPKMMSECFDLALPIVEGKISLSKRYLEEHIPNQLTNWLLGIAFQDNDWSESLKEVQEYWYFKDNPDTDYVFNLKSNNHLKYLFFTKLKEKPLSTTEKGEPQVDDDFLESITEEYIWVKDLLDYKKLNKLKSTYIEGALEQHINGRIYASFIQFGPPSGRYGCRGFNLQNIPRIKEEDSGISQKVLYYVNSIKKGFISSANMKIVNADYSQLEPRAFSIASKEPLLQAVFNNNEDLYGSIAKNIWNLACTPNEVKKKYPEYRQKAKVIALAVVYGSGAYRISELMKVSYDEAQEIITNYLEAYPGLQKYMDDCDRKVCNLGYVVTDFGRIRHLPEAKLLYDKYGMRLLNNKWAKENGLSEQRWHLKNNLNLAKNFPIQGVAAHIVNRAAIAIERRLKSANISGGLVANVHDELACIVPEERAEEVKSIMKECMENTTKLAVKLIAEPIIGQNWAEAK